MRRVNTIFFAGMLMVLLVSYPRTTAEATIPIAKIIQEGVKKVIRAVDLMIQRLQNKTIWLQNAQKVLENKINELKLGEIAEWTEKHRALYREYYEELWQVRNTIASYQRIKDIMERQVQIVQAYKRIWNVIQQDKRFTVQELEYMYKVYTGILNESVRNLDRLLMVIQAMKTQMSDAKRLMMIDECGEAIERNYYDLQAFNNQNIRLSLNRAKDAHEIESIKRMYGLPAQQ